MKKKILLTITIIMIIIFIPCVRAEGNMKVIFNTSFEEKIDINKIDEIFIMMDDSNLKDYEIVLKQSENFRLELNNLPSGDVVINSITVSRDYTVDYDYQYAITKTSDEETIISLLVTKVSKDPNRKKVEVSNEYIAEILGYDPLKTVTDNINITNSPTTTNTTIDNDNPIVITSSSSSTSTKSEEEIEEQEKIKQEEEKKQEQTKRKNIYLMILLVIIATLMIIGIVVGIKIANANK